MSEILDEENLQNKKYTIKDIKLIKFFVKYLKPYLTKFILVILLDFFVAAMFTIEPLFFSMIIDKLTVYFKVDDPNYLNIEVLRYYLYIVIPLDFLCLFGGSIGAYFVSYQLRKIGQHVVRDFRNAIFEHVLSLSQKEIKSLKIGSFVTRISNDTQNISNFFSNLLPQLFRAIISLFIIMITTFIKVHNYGFIFIAYIPIVAVITFFFRKKSKVYYMNEKNSISSMNSFLSENFQGVKITQSYNMENKRQKEFDVKNSTIYNNFIKSTNLFAIFYPSMFLLQMTCVIVVIAIGVPAVYSGIFTIGTFNLLYSYTGQFFQPIQTITSLFDSLSSILTSAERTHAVMAKEKEIEYRGEADKDHFDGKIEFRHVFFKYPNSETYVLNDVSFVIFPFKTVAFVGPTGAGKSTIISLITRQYDIQDGEILIDDRNIKEYSLDCLRHNIGVMLQDVFLFTGTIKSNISLSNKEISDEEIIQDSKRVGADSFISKLPNGYDEIVSEKGNNFSAGQRQLISFARALAYHPSLILLDEATANIDTETEKLIQNSLEEMRSIGTLVIVAHRLSTIKNADHIFVINHGKIIEEGNHRELMEIKGKYYNLYRLQNMQRDISSKEGSYEASENI